MKTTAVESYRGSVVTLSVTFEETDPGLTYLSGTIDWGDGSTTSIPRTLKVDDIVSASLSHTYAVGFFVIKATGRNYKSPIPENDVAIIYARVQSVSQVVPNVNRGFLFGPILPTSPDWNFSSGSDINLLASDLLNLLATRTGERLMNPDFGTQISRLIFDPSDSNLAATVSEEISSAVSRFEPRVKLIGVDVSPSANTGDVLIRVTAESNGNAFTVGVTY